MFIYNMSRPPFTLNLVSQYRMDKSCLGSSQYRVSGTLILRVTQTLTTTRSPHISLSRLMINLNIRYLQLVAEECNTAFGGIF